jgi:WD40 repeat protein
MSSRIFLSHSSKDNREAVALRQWLVDQDPPLANDIFLDSDRHAGIRAGTKWKDELQKASMRCEVVICLLSPNWNDSKECQAEYRTSENLNKRIFCARLEPSPADDLTRDWQRVDLCGEGPKTEIEVDDHGQRVVVTFSTEALLRLKDEIVGAGISAESFVWPPPNEPDRAPYRGWEPHEEVDAGVFFGRDAQLVRGLDALRGMRKSEVKSFFVILGASGAGKSSFLRAGLVPRLRRDDRSFVVVDIVRPEHDVLAGDSGLAAAICATRARLGLRGPKLADIKEACRGNTSRLRELLLEIQTAAATAVLLDLDAGQRPPTLVVPVDQAEELFSADADQEQTQRFLDIIKELTSRDSALKLSLIVAVTIRTDHYQPLQTAPQLAEVNSEVFDDLKPMPETQFKEVIEGPARRSYVRDHRLEFEPALVERLLEDCEKGADALPLLSLTLARLVKEYGSDGKLGLGEYVRMGGMRNIVQSVVDSALSRDKTKRREQLDLLRAAFIPCLVTVNPDSDLPVRRVARWDDLPTESTELLERFVDKRLLVRYERKDGDVVEVALESLFEHWDELKGWLTEERENLIRADGLLRGAADWVKNHRNDDWLLDGLRLVDAETLLKRSGFEEHLSSAREFVDASRCHEDDRIETERRRAASARRRSRLLLAVGAAAAVIALVAVFGLIAWMQSVRHTKAWQLMSQADQMLEGGRAGGDVRALQELLAADSLGAKDAGEVVNKRRNELKIIENPPPTDHGVTAVRSAAVSPDGSRIVSGNDDHTARMWDANTGSFIRALDVGGDGPAWSVAFSPDGRWVATGSENGIVQVWDANTGAKIGVPMPHTAAVHSVAFSDNSQWVVTGSADGAVRVWDAISGKENPGVHPAGHLGRPVESVAFGPGRHVIASAGDDNTVRLWDANTGQECSTPISVDAAAMTVAFNPSGDRLAVGRFDGAIEIIEIRDGHTLNPLIAQFQAHFNAVNSVAFNTEGTRIVSAGVDNTVRVWDLQTLKPIGSPLTGHHGEVTSAMFSHDDTRIVSSSKDGSVREWDAVTGLPMPAGQGQVRVATFSPDGRHIASAGDDGTIKIWTNPVTSTPVQLGQPSDFQHGNYMQGINSLAFNRDGTQIVSGGFDGVVRLWDVKTAGLITSLPNDLVGPPANQENMIQSVAFSTDGSRIVSGGFDGAIRLWDAHSHQSLGTRSVSYPIQSVAFSPDDRYIASGSGSDDTLQLWDASTLQPDGQPMVGHKGLLIYSVSFSPDSQRIASGNSDGTVRVWSLKTRQQAVMYRDENSVNSVAFAHDPEHPWIVSGGSGGRVQVWNTDSDQPIGLPFKGDQYSVTSVTFSPDDHQILSGGSDGNLHLWSAPEEDSTDVICSKINTNMSHQQWHEWVSWWMPYKQCPHLRVPNDPEPWWSTMLAAGAQGLAGLLILIP